MRLILPARAAAAVIAAAAAALAFPTAAYAHVTVTPGTAVQGGYAKVTFRVPNEKATAGTVKLEVAIPPETPVASVSVRPVPGWTAATETTHLPTPIKTADGDLTDAVSRITWTATTGAGIAPHEFQEFDVSLGPLPQSDRIVFKTLQTYADGDVVRWIDDPAADHPAPILQLTRPGTTTTTTDRAIDPAALDAAALDAAAVMHEDGAGDGTAISLGIAALAAGLAALTIALLAHRRTTRHSPS